MVTNPSSFLNDSKFFSKLLTLQFWIDGANSTPDPGKVTDAVVSLWVYSAPDLTILIDVISPLELITAVRTAPIPSPSTEISGGVL